MWGIRPLYTGHARAWLFTLTLLVGGRWIRFFELNKSAICISSLILQPPEFSGGVCFCWSGWGTEYFHQAMHPSDRQKYFTGGDASGWFVLFKHPQTNNSGPRVTPPKIIIIYDPAGWVTLALAPKSGERRVIPSHDISVAGTTIENLPLWTNVADGRRAIRPASTPI